MNLAAHLTKPTGPAPERNLYAQLVSKGFSSEMVRDGRYKLIRHVRGPRQGLEELYDLQQDPLERINLAAERPAQVAGLRKQLNSFHTLISRAASRVPAEQVQKLDRDTERALRSLGYIK